MANDYYKAGKPVYEIQNINLTLNQPFEDGAHILYVNGAYRDGSELGRLMHDFNCTQAGDMHFKELAEKTRYLKENPKGVKEMCKVMEDLRNESYAEGREEGRAEGREKQAKETAFNMIKQGFTLEQISGAINFSTEVIKGWFASPAV